MAQKISRKISFIGENIKRIRELKKISQADFATRFNLSRPSVGAYEEGRSEPKIETIIRIANYFRISIDILLTRQLTTKEIFNLDQINEKMDKAHTSKTSERIFVNQLMRSSISLVPAADSIDYLINYQSPNFINALPSIQLPTSSQKVLRAFEVIGSEMEYHQQGLHHGDIVVCEIESGENYHKYVEQVLVLVTKELIRIRRLKQVENESLILKSDDPNYEDKLIPFEEVRECWVVKAAYTSYLKAPSMIEERVLKLEHTVELMKKNP